MAKRITIDTDKTNPMIAEILRQTSDRSTRILFLVPAGQGGNVISRIRTGLSRVKMQMRMHGRLVKQFTLRMTLHKETHNGLRYDAIVVWQEQNTKQAMIEQLERYLDA